MFSIVYFDEQFFSFLIALSVGLKSVSFMTDEKGEPVVHIIQEEDEEDVVDSACKKCDKNLYLV